MQKSILLLVTFIGLTLQAQAASPVYWIKAKAATKEERTIIAKTGVAIEAVMDDYVVATGHEKNLEAVRRTGRLLTSFAYPMNQRDFPAKDSNFHNYQEVLSALKDLATQAPDLVAYEVVGKSLEGRDIVNVRISGDLKNSSSLPAVLFIGTHHAREHVSTEVPLMLAQHLVTQAKAGDPSVLELIKGREIDIIPLLNPDGAEFDIARGDYAGWRKNRRPNADGTFGVDLNRNYGFKWGQDGASGSPDDETYWGSAPFSEPETQAVKNFVESHTNINVLLSFHTFSELILYPWGYTYDPVGDAKDMGVFKTMAQKMSTWNGYKPEPGSGLYLVSGELGDWAYSQHKIFSFTFEMDPKFAFGIGGFYPGQAKVPGIFQKNLPACLYLIQYADNPYRVLTPGADFGLSTPLVH